MTEETDKVFDDALNPARILINEISEGVIGAAIEVHYQSIRLNY